MGKKRYFEPATKYAEIRELYNETSKIYMSQEKLGKKLGGLSKATVSRIENGDVIPDTEVLEKYCEVFNVSMEYFTGKKETTKKKNATILKSLGLTDDTVKTLQLIKGQSTDTENISALINAFLCNEVATLSLFQEILFYIKAKQGNQQICTNNFDVVKAMLVSSLLNYIDTYVEPQYQIQLRKNKKFEEVLSELPVEDYPYEEMMKESYENYRNFKK